MAAITARDVGTPPLFNDRLEILRDKFLKRM
jgi:hypothetical protein